MGDAGAAASQQYQYFQDQYFQYTSTYSTLVLLVPVLLELEYFQYQQKKFYHTLMSSFPIVLFCQKYQWKSTIEKVLQCQSKSTCKKVLVLSFLEGNASTSSFVQVLLDQYYSSLWIVLFLQYFTKSRKTKNLNEYLVARIGFDTDNNGPLNVWG